MKPGYFHRYRLVAITALLLSGTAAADVFHLKDGRRLEGSIVSEREDAYVIEVQVTRSIKEEVTISKDEIQQIEREQPDHTAFAGIAALMPVPDLLTEADYKRRIRNIRDFIAQFPGSPLLADANEILNAHLTEFEVIEAGGIKIDGELLDSGARLANAYLIESRIAEEEIRGHIQESRLLHALRAFHAFEEDFTGSKTWHSLLPLMRQVVSMHQARAIEMLDGHAYLVTQQETGLSRMGREERQASQRAIAERDAALKERHDHERGIRGYWLSINAYYKPALEETIRFAEQEIRRIEAAAAQPLRDPTPAELWRNAIAAIQAGDSSEISRAISAAQSARMPERFINQLQKLASETE